MFTATLFDFQGKHEENLLAKCAEHEELVLSAPTGAGKTVLVSKFIDDYLDENPNTVFLWLCPGAGGLEKQSQDSFREVTSGIPDGDVYAFISEGDPRGKVFFINWDKINRSSNVVLREGEHRDLMGKVLFCHTNGIDIFMLIDEEHKYQATANEYISNIQPVHVLRISATPVSKGDHTEIIPDDEVIGAGLIASGISINEGVSAAIEENNSLDDDLLLLDLADKKRKEIEAEYIRRGLRIKPLVLIQFPNGYDEWINRVKQALEDLGYSANSGLVTSWFSGDHPDNPEEIKKLDGQYAFLLFKQAIATGWDCPRAKILVKLREGGTERFNVQTVGRVRRMPERVHYDCPLIDNCYVYTLDSEYTEGLTNSIGDSFYTYLYKRKTEIPNIVLQKETLNGSDRYAVNPEAVVKVVREQMLTECDLDHDGKLDKHEMEISKGYVFGTKLKTEAIEGVARTTHDIRSLNRIFGGEHQINNHDDGFIIRDAKRRIASAIGIDENISNNALRVLFGPLDMQMSIFSEEEIAFEREHKLIDGLSLREYNAFLVNNRERLVEVFSDISADRIAKIEEADIVSADWSIPREQYYKQHKRIPSTKIMSKNAFADYGNNILVQPSRTFTEISLEGWCEHYDPVKWYYKNGDKGDEYFSIVYRMAFRRSNFYPDYIIKLKNGDVSNRFANVINLSKQLEASIDSLASVCGKKHPEMIKLCSTAKDVSCSISLESQKCYNWLKNEFSERPVFEENTIFVSFDSLIERFRTSDNFSEYHFHIYEITRILRKLSEIEYYSLLAEVKESLNSQCILFLGNPGTGKTHGVSAFAEKMLVQHYHIPLIIQARSIPEAYSWRDIIINTLGLADTWNEDELWQALVSSANRNRFQKEYIEQDVSICPKILIIEILQYLNMYGIIGSFCRKGTGISADKYFYYAGIQGYFDYASSIALLNEYKAPSSINFELCGEVDINTLYCLAIISMQQYKYLITRNPTLKKSIDDYAFFELQFYSLQHTDPETAMQFRERSLEIMQEGADALVTIVNRLVLPLSRFRGHPLGTSLLDDFLNTFETPAQRDIVWSLPAYLRNSNGRRWEKNDVIAILYEDDNEYELTEDDQADGLPLVYAWALSNVRNPDRKKCRDMLMVWAQSNPWQYHKLFLHFAEVNDPQIRSDLFSIIMCLVYGSADSTLVKEVADWILSTTLAPSAIDQNRDISVRYYAIAIVEKAKLLGLLTDEDAVRYLPPYSADNCSIALNKDALAGTRMGGYSAIDYDLARYVLIDHFCYLFNFHKSKQFDNLIETIAHEQPDYARITPEQFILSAAYAFILRMGWNEEDFYNYEKDEAGNYFGGADCSINSTYHSATHGAQSDVMTICEKYVWQARNYISGFLSDRLLFGDEMQSVSDYGLLDDFIIPIQEIGQLDPDNIPVSNPWYVPEQSVVSCSEEMDSKIMISEYVKNAPDIDWAKWICVDNSDLKYSIASSTLLALKMYSCFYGLSGVETCLFINSMLLPTEEVPRFVTSVHDEDLFGRVCNPTDWDGGIEASCYITPREICWFPWKRHYDSYMAEEFPDLAIRSAVDRCCYNFPEYNDVYYSMASAFLRTLLGIVDTNGYLYYDKDKKVISEYSITGEKWRTTQEYVLVDRETVLQKLYERGLSLIWIMQDLRRETGIAKEQFGDFFVERRQYSVGYYVNNNFVVEKLISEFSQNLHD